MPTINKLWQLAHALHPLTGTDLLECRIPLCVSVTGDPVPDNNDDRDGLKGHEDNMAKTQQSTTIGASWNTDQLLTNDKDVHPSNITRPAFNRNAYGRPAAAAAAAAIRHNREFEDPRLSPAPSVPPSPRPEPVKQPSSLASTQSDKLSSLASPNPRELEKGTAQHNEHDSSGTSPPSPSPSIVSNSDRPADNPVRKPLSRGLEIQFDYLEVKSRELEVRACELDARSENLDKIKLEVKEANERHLKSLAALRKEQDDLKNDRDSISERMTQISQMEEELNALREGKKQAVSSVIQEDKCLRVGLEDWNLEVQCTEIIEKSITMSGSDKGSLTIVWKY
ncbi:hypothetical protein F4808DRAFT_457954 [Astrocystis sublimbata]|nr:hypothetical protein F4808DRAFT_457954 [Astrocystis sublimbata]